MKLLYSWLGLALFALASTVVGCGDLCGAGLGDAEGRWTFTVTTEGRVTEIVLDIDADGNVKVSGENVGDTDCEVLQDDFCDLEVDCNLGNDDFSFTLVKD